MTTGSAADALLGRVMLAFVGDRLPPWVERRLRDAPVAGMTVFRHHNVRSPGQVRELTDAFQRAGAARGGRAAVARSARAAAARSARDDQTLSGGGAGGAGTAPLLVAADQEGGQLQALGDDGPTLFAGNMALGAVGDAGLAERVGHAIGLESRAMGVNVVYAPALDLASEPANTALGIRSFGDDPVAVGRLGAAMVRGLQDAGVAATLKHFPGLGEVQVDSHHGIGVVAASRSELDASALAPFRPAIAAGARLVMSTHVAVPAITGDPSLPATLSRRIMHDLVRDELGFGGVTISDALDMRALAQGAAQAVEIIAAVRAGLDLLLCAADRGAIGRIEATLVAAASRGLFDETELRAASARVATLRSWLGAVGTAPDLTIVGCAEHRALSRQLAERSITIVRGTPRLPEGARILAVMPEPTDLTPADTSSTIEPGLGRALRARFGSVEEVVVGIAPTDAEITGVQVRARAADVDAVVVGTIDAIRQPAQFELVRTVASAAAGRPVVAVALRTPWDVAGYPAEVASVCTYSILPDSLDALAAGIAGDIPFPGRLPVAVPGISTRAPVPA